MAKKADKKTKIYKPKRIIDGKEIDQEPGTSWVAVPDKYRDKTVAVLYGGVQMTIKQWNPLMHKRFYDKFATPQNGRPSTYTLGYFRFTPDSD